MFVDRRQRGEDPWLPFKIGAFVLGAVLALAGIALNQRWLIPVAIVVLVIGYGFRFLDRVEGVEGGEADADGAERVDDEMQAPFAGGDDRSTSEAERG